MHRFENPRHPENSVEYENYSAYWETDKIDEVFHDFIQDKEKLVPKNVKPTLHNINLDVKKGSVNALVGLVGSGKTSFLMSFTGEMPKTTGSLRYKGSVAYVEQEPTIFAGTFKENVLFGKAYDDARYKQAVEACNLVNDLRLFSKGDDAEIVGGGMNLSGGQKARLAFARAVYADADIYLLDDPLSAVDPKVARSLYKNAIEGALKGKTI
ncbi:MAG: ATP-binding cassette domain-containing protein, partial [Cytophagaceae bacterium]